MGQYGLATVQLQCLNLADLLQERLMLQVASMAAAAAAAAAAMVVVTTYHLRPALLTPPVLPCSFELMIRVSYATDFSNM